MATDPDLHADLGDRRRVPATAAEALALGLDPSGMSAAEIDRIVRHERGRRWKEENRDAIEGFNRWVEKNGLPLEKYRVW